ncbi:MAG: class I SAM-dependent DNA methyltransferase [Hyphomonadaceae bacterium]|nr:class I SAM-dependent DNA methyltransferase [Hyphomonadaceae bacterium]
MTPLQFVEKWRDSVLRERQGAQSHFIELCDLLGEPRPADPASYCFERGVEKAGGGDGWADVWRKGCFAWEYKGKHKDLGAALRQLQTYTLDLQMPPYLVVSDMDRIIVRTNWNNTISNEIVWTLDDLLDAGKRDLLKQVFSGSEKLKPKLSPQELTDKAARAFGDIGRRLQERGHDPRPVAHFLNRLIFCMFAEDVGLLPDKLFSRMMKAVETNPEAAAGQMRDLFAKMHKGGFFGEHKIDWFNGGLFDSEDILPLEVIDLKQIAKTADDHDWSEIDPAIFGTLFEQALKATRERPALGAHYTDREKILKIVDPVITRPLMAEWDVAHGEIAAFMDEARAAEGAERAIREEAAAEMAADPKKAKAGEEARRKRTTAARRERTKALAAAKDRLDAFLDRLSKFRVLDPACGSGNFLYVALHALHDIERRAHGDCLRLGLEPPPLRVSVRQLRGIEIERYAAELARVTLWIGDLQWLKKNGYLPDRRPILDTLDQIEERDALLNADGSEAEWPETDVIIGNPPFLGDKKMVASLGAPYVNGLRNCFASRVPGGADFVMYWFDKARAAIGTKHAVVAGLVATQAVRRGASSEILQHIASEGTIFNAWSDQPWAIEGAAVRVSTICFSAKSAIGRILDGHEVGEIHSDLASGIDLGSAISLIENDDSCFIGIQKSGPFDIPGSVAREWLVLPANPTGLHNCEVLRPLVNGSDLVDRSGDTWLIDFGVDASEESASYFTAPFEYLRSRVPAARSEGRNLSYSTRWWLHERPRPALRKAIAALSRMIVTPRVSKHRLFAWLDARMAADTRLVVVARDDDTAFGVLHSRVHELWTLRRGGMHGVGNDPQYTPSLGYMTFPFPEGLTPNIPAAQYADDPRAIAIADAARELNEKREAWLNPPEWVDRVPEVVAGYPDRIVPKDSEAAQKLKDRTLTKLYNERPAWLDHLHRRLDAAVAAAYGWPADLSDEDILAKLFTLNQERAAAGR